LVHEIADGRMEQVGIVSWGVECGKYDFPGVNFTNILCKASTPVDLSSEKKIMTTWLNFYAFRSERVKAAHRMLMKLTPGVNFTNILQAAFL